MKVINKDKAKGNSFGTMKKMKKKNRLLEEKETARRTENKRINAENRKQRRERDEEIEKISQVQILDFIKGMIIIEIENSVEKRALLFDERQVNKSNFKDKISSFEIKVYGENVKISKLKGYQEIEETLLWKLEELFN